MATKRHQCIFSISSIFIQLIYKGEWKGPSAGGCGNEDSVINNPQYLMTLQSQTTVRILLLQPKGTYFILSLKMFFLYRVFLNY